MSGIDRRVRVPIAQNETPFSKLAGPLTAALRRRIAQSGIEVAGLGQPGHTLEVTIVEITQTPGMLSVESGELVPADIIVQIVVSARLADADGEIIQGPKDFEANGRAYTGETPLAEEALASRRLTALLEDIADAVAMHFFHLTPPHPTS